MIYRKNVQNQQAFKNNVFKLFTDAVGGDLEEFTKTVYSRFVVEDFGYHDDMWFFGVEAYFIKKVVPHKIAVYQAGLELSRQEFFSDLYINKEEFLDNLWLHDISKFSANEAFGYSGYRFGAENSKESKAAFEKSWHHHKMHNPHHPEHWLNPNREGKLEIIPMPKIYVLEMIADWIGAGKTYGNSLEEWLPNNLHKFQWHPETDRLVKTILSSLIPNGLATEKQP